MTASPGRHEKAGAAPRTKPALGLRTRAGTLQRAVMRHPRITPLLAIQRAYDRGGGGMLTASLAFFAFFTVMPTLLLLTSLLGFFIADVDQRNQLVESLFEQLDPLYDVATAIVDNLAAGASAGTLLGLLGLIWGAAGFYGALEGSMQRMFPGPRQRDIVAVRLRGILAVALVLTGMLAAIILTAVVPLLGGAVSLVAAPIVATSFAVVSCLVVYVAVPPDGPSVRAASLPALAAGVAIGVLTTLFSAVAPLLVQSYLALGVVGSVFIALVWFNIVFQILLYGAAFARLRRDDQRRRTRPPSL